MRYIKYPVVVEAIQVSGPIDLGDVGAAGTDDWVLQAASGSLHLMDDATFQTKYKLAAPNADLTGTEVE